MAEQTDRSPARKTTPLGAVACGLALLGIFVVPLLFGLGAIVAGAVDMQQAPAETRKQTAGAVGLVLGVIELLIGVFLLVVR